jgi:hypothetical protein
MPSAENISSRVQARVLAGFFWLSYHRGMGWQRRLCACALALVACGDNQDTRTTSGSRVRLSWIDFGGGARLLSPTDFWDDGRQESCTPRQWTDGNTYCTPSATDLYPYYTSSDCSSVGYYVESFERPTYVTRFVDATGEGISRVDLVARPEPTLLDEYWVKDDEGCHGPNDGVGGRWYKAGEEVPRSDLVRIRIRESTGNGRVAVRASVTDDGMYAPLEFEDRLLHVECSLSAASEDETWCIPPYGGDLYYRDASCSEPVLERLDDAPPPRGVQAETCEPRVYTVGAQTADAPAFERIGNACQASTGSGDRWFELHEHPIASIARTHVATGARLEQVTMNIDGTTVVAPQLFDTETGESCTRALSVSGEYRCVPRDVGWVIDMFADAACTIPVKVGLVPTRCEGQGAPRYARNFGTPLIYHLLGRRPSLAYSRDGSTCKAETSAFYALYDLGAPIPDDAWPRGVLVRD